MRKFVYPTYILARTAAVAVPAASTHKKASTHNCQNFSAPSPPSPPLRRNVNLGNARGPALFNHASADPSGKETNPFMVRHKTKQKKTQLNQTLRSKLCRRERARRRIVCVRNSHVAPGTAF